MFERPVQKPSAARLACPWARKGPKRGRSFSRSIAWASISGPSTQACLRTRWSPPSLGEAQCRSGGGPFDEMNARQGPLVLNRKGVCLPNGPSAVDEPSREHGDATRQFRRREKAIGQSCQPSAEKSVGSRNDAVTDCTTGPSFSDSALTICHSRSDLNASHDAAADRGSSCDSR